MATIIEGKLTFEFPAGWIVSKFDEWSFFTGQFRQIGNATSPCSNCGNHNTVGVKGIDILALQGKECCWLIEIKDYREHRREKLIKLPDEVALKVRDCLAALVAARVNANDAAEKTLARNALQCSQFKVALHLEQPAKSSKLFPRAFDPANVEQRLKQLIKSVAPHPLVVYTDSKGRVAWSVSQSNQT